MITAEQGAKLIAPHVEKSWPEHRSDLFRILGLALDHAWNEGKWYGMSREYFVSVRNENSQNYFIGPKGFDVLLAVNINGKPRMARGLEFQFHKNGYGSVTQSGSCSWLEDIIDFGEKPILQQLNIESGEGVMLGVRSLGPETGTQKVKIRGRYYDDNRVYTFVKDTLSSQDTCGCISTTSDSEIIKTVEGLEIPITDKFRYISNICFNSIDSITKDVTVNPVEVVAIYPDGTAKLISRMEPYDVVSRYRKYLAPADAVCDGVAHALFKVSPQGEISNDSQPLIVSNKEAIIALAMGIHKVYYTQEQQVGQVYLSRGINALEKQKREEEPNSHNFPIQVVGVGVDDVPEIFNRIS